MDDIQIKSYHDFKSGHDYFIWARQAEVKYLEKGIKTKSGDKSCDLISAFTNIITVAIMLCQATVMSFVFLFNPKVKFPDV